MTHHRADHRSRQRAALGRPSAPGRRRAEQPATSRRPSVLARRMPAAPTLVGLSALVAAAAGAVTVQPVVPASTTVQLSSASQAAAGAGAQLTPHGGTEGTDAVGFVGGPRERALSRDSERQALEDAADARLQQAAEEKAAERNAELKSLGRAAEARAGQIAKNQWVLPTTGYHLTARFGMAGGLWSNDHTGLDFAAPVGTPIVSVANGTVTETGSAGAYGNRTVMTLDDGTEIWYCHQNSIGVSPGDKVSAGQQIGEVGNTGNTTGPHLHLEVRPGGGDPVDPYQALVFHGLKP